MAIPLKNLDRALNPHTVAVVGDTKARGYRWLKNMSTVRGKLYSVQLDEREFEGIEELGVPNYTSLLDIPDEIDYVLVSVPRVVATRVLHDCIEKQVGGVAFFTSGFAETDTEEGHQLQAELAEMAEDAGLVVIGPNCMGLYNPQAGVRFQPRQKVGFDGPVTFVSQSGSHAGDFSIAAQSAGVRVGKVLSFGNGAVLGNADYLEYFKDDDATRYLAMYVEGLRDGPRFFRQLRETTRRKPVILWKGGMTEAGQRATASHTGALAGPAEVWNALCRQTGAIQASSTLEVIDLLKVLMMLPPFTGDGIALAGGAGGQSVAMTDTFSLAGLRVPTLSDASYAQLGEWFSLVGASFRNPIDLGSNREELDSVLQVLDADENIDCVVMQVRAPFDADDWDRVDGQIQALGRFRETAGTPVAAIVYSSRTLEEAEALLKIDERLLAQNVPSFPSYERAATAIRKVIDYYRFLADGVVADGAAPTSP